MKAILLKEGDTYFLEKVTMGGWRTIANSLEKRKGPLYDLSIKNCQAIERGYDLDELAHIRAEILNSYTSGTKWADDIDKLLTRYREVIELMGDKKFTEEDIRKAFKEGLSFTTQKAYHDYSEDKFVQSLQQNEWEVEIEMEPDVDTSKLFGAIYGQKPKLDANGCLILKRVV